MKLFVFWVSALILLVSLFFMPTNKEGSLPIIACSATLGFIAFLTFLDRWRNPETYAKDASKEKIIKGNFSDAA